MSPSTGSSLIETYLPKVQRYLDAKDWTSVPGLDFNHYRVEPLAQGEYNLNYLLVGSRDRVVFRVNVGTQINRDDQVNYEFKTLRLLSATGRTPLPLYVDDSRSLIDRGILIMEYLPGRALDYRTDLVAAARLFADIHRLQPPETSIHLIREQTPLTLIFEECSRLLSTYFASPLADRTISKLLERILSWAETARQQESFFMENPWNCIVNTEVNSGNFIINDAAGSIHLIDWEMPRWGDPTSDLCHFCSPLTTLWKTDHLLSNEARDVFYHTYRSALRDQHLETTLDERIRRKEPFVLLRGISWSAMGWVAYQTEFAGIRNKRTWQTLQRYLDADFIRSLFAAYLPI